MVNIAFLFYLFIAFGESGSFKVPRKWFGSVCSVQLFSLTIQFGCSVQLFSLAVQFDCSVECCCLVWRSDGVCCWYLSLEASTWTQVNHFNNYRFKWLSSLFFFITLAWSVKVLSLCPTNTMCMLLTHYAPKVFDNKKLLVRSKNELSFLCKQVKGNFLIEGIWQALV